MPKKYNKLWLDFETYSEVNINKQGGVAYVNDPSTQLVCLGFALDDEPVQVWNPSKTMPDRILDFVADGGTVYEHGTFDYYIWNVVATRDFGWPSFALGLDQVVDTIALCQSFTLPRKLAEAGAAMKITMPKDTDGKRLIKKCCCPKKDGTQPMPWDPGMAHEFKKLERYCGRDVESMRELVQKVPRDQLLPIEHEIWKMTCAMNIKGLPVAYDEVKAILAYIERYIAKKTKDIPSYCGGAFEKVTQVAKIQAWCKAQGYNIPNMQAATVERALNDENCPPAVKTILELRQELGKTSTAKYKKIMALAYKDVMDNHYYVYENLVYHGAAPGRWTGQGFQMHNLPRASVPDPEAEIKKFLEGIHIDNPVGTAKALIRPMIKAPKGRLLIVSDYSSIENRVLAWIAMDWETIEDFKKGIDQYITMASARYGVPYDEIKEGCAAHDTFYSAMRQMGKVIILGCGYGMGWETFIETAREQFGMHIEEQEARDAISAYREKYHLVKKLWNELKLACVRAVLTGQRQTYGLITFGTSTVNGVRWLAMRLPSGKSIYYCNPRVESLYIPKYESMGKVPTVVHDGVNPYSKKWSKLKLIPGRITENAVQGTAREIMAQGMLNVQERQKYIDLIGTVHDEALGLFDDGLHHGDALRAFNHDLCDIEWARDCPIAAEGYIAKRYRKE